MSDQVADKVIQLIAAMKRVPKENISVASTFEQLSFDSLDAINLAYEIESEFNISIPDELVQSLKSLKDVQQLVENLKTVLAKASDGTDTEQ